MTTTCPTPRPPGGAPEGSGQIEELLNDYFAAQGLSTEPTAFDGRSDYGPFIAEGIPAGDLLTCAEGTKTAAQAAIYSGMADVAYDQCYHLRCDTVQNINFTALDQMSDAAAHTALTLAKRDFARKPLTNPPPLASGDGDVSGGGLHAEHDHDTAAE